jgi:predicted GIY-YIG superfamily endonuclease
MWFKVQDYKVNISYCLFTMNPYKKRNFERDPKSKIDLFKSIHDGLGLDIDKSDAYKLWTLLSNDNQINNEITPEETNYSSTVCETEHRLNGIKTSAYPSCIYVLNLEGGRIYVGKSKDYSTALSRIERHKNKTGSAWTREHPVVSVLEIFITNDVGAEEATTLRYVIDRGIDLVRGGSTCELNLSGASKEFYSKAIASATNKCYTCGLAYHFANECPKRSSINS